MSVNQHTYAIPAPIILCEQMTVLKSNWETFLSAMTKLVPEANQQLGLELQLALVSHNDSEYTAINIWQVPNGNKFRTAQAVLPTWKDYRNFIFSTLSMTVQVVDEMLYSPQIPKKVTRPAPANFVNDLLIYDHDPKTNNPECFIYLKKNINPARSFGTQAPNSY